MTKSSANGVAQVLDAANPGDAVDTMFQDSAAFSRFRRADQAIRKIRARFKLDVARAERHPSAKLTAVFASAQLIEAAVPSDTDRKLVLTAARTGLGHAGNVIHSMRRIFSKPGSGDGHPLAFAADTGAGHLSSDTASHASGGADAGIQQAYLTYRNVKCKFKKPKSSRKNDQLDGHRGNPIDKKSWGRLRCQIRGLPDLLVPRRPERNQLSRGKQCPHEKGRSRPTNTSPVSSTL